MPFMIGSAPVRRTLEYLKSGSIIFRENVKIFSINYCLKGEHHEGARNFVFWNLPQVQYKNPQVQCLTLKNLTPTPFIRIFFENGENIIIDIDSRKKEEIVTNLSNFKAICKTREELLEESDLSKRKESSFYFGYSCERHCICEALGQVPCPDIVPLPPVLRGRGRANVFKKKFSIPPFYFVQGLEEENVE